MSNVLSISNQTASARTCIGLGVQADCYIYDDVNRQMGVDEADHERWERRLRLLRPSIARIFLPLCEFNPSGDGQTYDWDTEEMQRQYRNLKVLAQAGAQVNLCMGPWTNDRMTQPGSERWAVDLVEHLIKVKGFDHIRWLSLFNEPDAMYDMPFEQRDELERRGLVGGLPFDDYVAKHRAALDLLADRSLDQCVRLVVCDAVWPPQRRLVWLQRLADEFGPDAVGYSFHIYSPDADGFFDHPDSKPFEPPPIAEEARSLREAVGETAELICWEYNQAGWCQNGSAAWMGCGSRGEDHGGTVETAAAHARKTLTMLGCGIDGLSHWCVGDMFYRSGLPQGVMYAGLWRYKWESWIPRPVYFYYAALMQTFTPGTAVHAVDRLPEGVTGLAAVQDNQTIIALVCNREATLQVDAPVVGTGERLRVTLDRLPRQPDVLKHEVGNEDEPLSNWEALPTNGDTKIDMQTNELTLLRWRGGAV